MPRKTGQPTVGPIRMDTVNVTIDETLLVNGNIKVAALSNDGENISSNLDEIGQEVTRLRTVNEVILGDEVEVD